MAWERRRNGRRYYFRARRIGQKVVKTYVGAGGVGEQAAQADATERAERLARRQAELELRARVVAANASLVALGTACEDIAHSAFAEAGFYQHHRQWRKFGGKKA
jgi:hypothetical protein